MTNSIVGRDLGRNQIGAACASASFASGAGVLWVEAGIGAVATQAFAERSYGPIGLSMMSAGAEPRQVILGLTASDDLADLRQVGVVDRLHAPAAYTGTSCVGDASHALGVDCVAQANMMSVPGIPGLMVAAFESTAGSLADRLFAALVAAQNAGGDFRGVQSAAVLVREGDRGIPEWKSRVVNVRVDDSADPLTDLRRLIDTTMLYRRWNLPLELAMNSRTGKAIDEARMLQRDFPGNPEVTVRLALALAAAGGVEEAAQVLRPAIAADHRYLELARALLRKYPPQSPVDLDDLV